ncbi:metal-binding protein [Nodosilinea sp. LEGE 07088]|uniref:metal-binding protein n=1 Tax=Nodosilinea sp. LEGE 07088 TaxID=2777968 RepID=UPI00187DE651|nr:metal-binding protein [Nodosilinea sp. LEGE 07088]MBE9139918.1 metal-binding protein [Nodosilinea sp. LEGE 07088]
MSSGRTHDRITLWALPLVVLATFRLTLDGRLTAVVCLGFLLGGWVLGPDLDIHSVQYKRWGWLRWIWLPYRGSIRHRSRWSHGPIIGTVVRVLYLSFWLGLGGLIVIDLLNNAQRTALTWGDLIDRLGWGLMAYWPWWLALMVGLELGALSHYVADWLSSAAKRGRGKGKRRKARGSRRAKRR